MNFVFNAIDFDDAKQAWQVKIPIQTVLGEQGQQITAILINCSLKDLEKIHATVRETLVQESLIKLGMK